MNWQSILLLLAVIAAFVYAVIYIVRKNRRHPGCGSCSCCGESKCGLRNSSRR